MKRLFVLAIVFLAASCAQAPQQGAQSKTSATPGQRIAQTAHPLATRAALDMLDRGGNAVDAAVAAQMMLGLVEPQMSGVGGGTVVVTWDATTRKLAAFDGLSAAPKVTTASNRTDVDGRLLPAAAVRQGGRSIAIPGTVQVLWMVHERYGRLPWATLFEPAIHQAEDGFPISELLRRVVRMENVKLSAHPDLAIYFDAAGNVLPEGTIVRNPEYAKTLRRIAAHGIDGMLGNGGAERIVQAAQRGEHPSLMTVDDLREYKAVEREPVCGPFLAYRLCSMSPPSYGGIYVLQMLQMLEARAGGHYDFNDPAFVHLFIEAGKLGRQDRSMYVGDPDFTSVPTQALVARSYVASRAASLDLEHSNPSPRAGTPVPVGASLAPEHGSEMGGTSQLTIADAAGDIVAMTTTVNLGFGSGIMVDGYLLNDAMVNFSAAPRPGQSIANAEAPRKRPYTSMAPTIVFDSKGEVIAAGGSAGGSRIPDYVTQGWVEILANGATPQQALAEGHFTTGDPGKIVIERDTNAAGLANALRAKGHNVEVAPLMSGAGYIVRREGVWIGGADPRRGGNAAN